MQEPSSTPLRRRRGLVDVSTAPCASRRGQPGGRALATHAGVASTKKDGMREAPRPNPFLNLP